jgi:hypothetical protein
LNEGKVARSAIAQALTCQFDCIHRLRYPKKFL